MSRANRSGMTIGCPECDTDVSTTVPPGPGIGGETDSNRLQGKEATCGNCGHELELYYY